MPSTMYQIRMDEQEKADTFAVFKEMGIKPAQAVRLFFRQVRNTRALPFVIDCAPNEKTARLLSLPDGEKDYETTETVDALFDSVR